MFRRDLMKRLNSYYNNKFKVAKLFIIKSSSMIPMRTGQTAGGLPAQNTALDTSMSSQTNKKATSKPRQVQAPGGSSAQGIQAGFLLNPSVGPIAGGSHSSNRQGEALVQTAKIPQHYLNGTAAVYPKGMISGANTLQAPSSLSMNATSNGLIEKANVNLTASQKKRVSLKKLDEEYSKTIEQLGSPNSATINLENISQMKEKTQSLQYQRANGSGASSPQQVKSRTSIGKYGGNGQNPVSMSGAGMAIYNNYNNQAISSSQQRNSYVSKSQMGGAAIIPTNQTVLNNSALGTGSRSRSKTTNRKKRNLYTSVGNYYQSQQPSNLNSAAQSAPTAATGSASRVTKRVHNPQNFLDNLEQTNILGNLAVAHHFLHGGSEEQASLLAKKRNKSSTKSYNNNGASSNAEQHNNSSEIIYSSHLTKKNPMTNNFFDMSQFSSNHNSMAKNFENSFQGFQAGFLPNQSKSTSLTAVAANKHRPASSHKTALMAAAAAIGSGTSSSAKIQNKKKAGQALRKSVNNVGGMAAVSATSSTNPMNQSANYGSLQQNAYDFLSNASLFNNTGKAARRSTKPGGGNSAIDSRCSQTKDLPLHHTSALTGFAKSQVSSNTAFGHQQVPLNNTSHTTICSNRKQGSNNATHLLGPGDIVSGKKNSLQQHMLQQNYGQHHTSEILTAGEISSDRQTLKMNDFLKQIEAYSNDKLDKFMPSLSQASNSNLNSNQGGLTLQQNKVAEQVKALIDKEMAVLAILRTNSSKQQRYPQGDESRGIDSMIDPGDCDEEEDLEEAQQPDYEHLLNVVSDSFNSLIATFYLSTNTAAVGVSLARVKESYEEIINSIVENLSQQIEILQNDNEGLYQENATLKERNDQLEKIAANSDTQVAFAKKNEVLGEQLKKLAEENQALRKEQKDRDSQLNESRKMIEKLTVSQKQLLTNQSNIQNTSGSSQPVVMRQAQVKAVGKSSTTSVPPLDLAKLNMVQQQVGVNPLQMLSNDSLQTLDKALLNANLQEASSGGSSQGQHDGTRILEELYSNQAPFQANQSEISYQNSDYEDEEERKLGENAVATQSGRLSSIAQDKSPLMKPFIPPLNLNGLNNRTQAARQNTQPPIQQPVPQPPAKNPKFKLDLSSVSSTNKDQDSTGDYGPQKQKIQAAAQNSLGLNLANLKQQKGIVDFQDEFMAKYDEYSESWRDAMRREKRF